MKFGWVRMRIISYSVIGLAGSVAAWAQQPKTFSSPDEAAKAVVQAASQPGLPPLLDIFGAESKNLFPTGEEGQREYASVDRNNDGMLEYAQRILSTPGQKDGLYWDGPDSPARA